MLQTRYQNAIKGLKKLNAYAKVDHKIKIIKYDAAIKPCSHKDNCYNKTSFGNFLSCCTSHTPHAYSLKVML